MSQAHVAASLQIGGLEPSSKLLLLVLCLGADRQGRGEATSEELHQMTGLATRTIRAHMAHLYAKGFIHRQRYEHAYQLSFIALVTATPK